MTMEITPRARLGTTAMCAPRSHTASETSVPPETGRRPRTYKPTTTTAAATRRATTRRQEAAAETPSRKGPWW
jgi:hypothetical protein